GAGDQVGGVRRQLTGPLPPDLHPQAGAGGDGDGVVVPQAQGQPDGVEARTQVGRARRDGQHDPRPGHGQRRPAHPSRPSASAAWKASTGTRTGSISLPSAVRSAHWGSLSPCPVTVQTTRDPGASPPAAATLSRPATDAAEAGSTKTPSRVDSSRCAARISSSVTASIRPPDSSRAASAWLQDAGLPMRIAVATVSGWSTGWPSTRGAAPAAWKPHIAGSRVAGPATAASVVYSR